MPGTIVSMKGPNLNTSNLIFLMLLFFSSAVFAEKEQKVFYGALDNVYAFEMVLEIDGQSIEGSYSFDGGNEKYSLSGTLNDGLYQISEYDSSGLHSASLEMTWLDNHLSGSWQNVNGSAYFSIYAYESKKSFSRIFDKHLRQFEGPIKGVKSTITLAHMANSQINGKIYYHGTDKTFRLRGNCENWNCSEIAIQVKDDFGLTIDQFTLSRSQNGLWYCGDSSDPLIRIYQRKQITQGKSHYNILYDIVYPNWKDEKYENWIDNLVVQFSAKCEAEFIQKFGKDIGKRPSYRAAIQAYAWVELDYLDENVISGIVHFQYPDQKVESKSFAFAKDPALTVDLNKSFKRSFNQDAFFKQSIKEFRSGAMNDHESIMEWIDKVPFSHKTLRKEGICLSTDFHPRFGKIAFVIPYSDFKQKLKKKSILHQLFEHYGN